MLLPFWVIPGYSSHDVVNRNAYLGDKSFPSRCEKSIFPAPHKSRMRTMRTRSDNDARSGLVGEKAMPQGRYSEGDSRRKASGVQVSREEVTPSIISVARWCRLLLQPKLLIRSMLNYPKVRLHLIGATLGY